MSSTHFLRPRFGRVIAVVAVIVCAVAAIGTALSGIEQLLGVIFPLALIGAVAVAAFWRPYVLVDDSGVTMANVLRTIRISWPAIDYIDTKYALSIRTADGTFTAWAAPAPGRHASFSAVRSDGSHLPESTYLAGTVRPGDLVTSESGAAAYVVRQRWEALRDAGHLANGTVEGPPQVTWHWVTIGILVLLTAGVVVGVAVS